MNTTLNETSMISPSKIVVKSDRARKVFDPLKIIELAKSIRETGVIQPIVVTREGESIVLVAGERRLRASLIAGLQEVPVVFKSVDRDGKPVGLSPLEQKLMELHENIGRQDLSMIEEAKLLSDIHDLQVAKHGLGVRGEDKGWKREDTAKLAGVSERSVHAARKLTKELKERPELLDKIKNDPLSVALQKIEMTKTTERVAKQIILGEIKPHASLLLGSCLDLIKAIPDESIDCVITDSPYAIEGLEGSRGGSVQTFTSMVKAGDNQTVEQVKILMVKLIPELHRVMKPHSHLWLFFGWDMYEFLQKTLPDFNFDICSTPIIWKKNKQTAMFKGYEPSPCYEQLLLVHRDRRNRRLKTPMKNLLEFDVIPDGSRTHVFEKPSPLLHYLIEQSTEAGQHILDPFAGTGSTIRTALQLGRSATGFEIEKDHWSKGTELLSKEKKS